MSKLKPSLKAKDVTSLMNDDLMSDESKKRTPEEKSRKMLKEEETIVNLELAVKKEKFKKSNMSEKKCDECDENGVREYEGKFRCEKHHLEAKRKANIEFERKETLKKYLIVISGVIGIIIGSIVIYQFVANL